MDFNKGKLQKLFKKKCEIKEIQFKGVAEIFTDDLKSTLVPYWNRELGRLLYPIPNLQSVLDDLKTKLKFLET